MLVKTPFLGSRQEALLHDLLEHPDGRTIEELAASLAISRTAVRQHLAALGQAGYVSAGGHRATPGRPGRVFLLTDAGKALFPKRYAWFSELLVAAVRDERGPEGLAAWLAGIARGLVPSLKGKVTAPTLDGRTRQTADLLASLGYEAAVGPCLQGEALAIVASNCPYHDVARKFPEVCAFDLQILADLLEVEIDHRACMARGDATCRFVPHSPTRDRPPAGCP